VTVRRISFGLAREIARSLVNSERGGLTRTSRRQMRHLRLLGFAISTVASFGTIRPSEWTATIALRCSVSLKQVSALSSPQAGVHGSLLLDEDGTAVALEFSWLMTIVAIMAIWLTRANRKTNGRLPDSSGARTGSETESG
jgi:hypothetical protein